ncbi:MAG: ABC transporter permease [Alphaproteobacteria bacterium]|nr:ABC transporter permease [Alphaproteobacteria bacterium]
MARSKSGPGALEGGALFSWRGRSVRRGLTALVVVLVGWEILGRTVLDNPLFFAPLSQVALAAVKLWQSGELPRDIAVSFTELAYGMVASVIVGVVIGVLLGISQRLRDYTELFIIALYATPLVAVAPLLILWLGIGVVSKAAVVFLTAAFPVLINTAAGVRGADAQLVEVAQAFAATRAQVVRKVLVPASVPFMLTGVRLAIGRGIVGVVVGELFGARAGLGYLIFTAGQTFDVPSLFVGVLTLALVGVGLTLAAAAVERHALRWRRPALDATP